MSKLVGVGVGCTLLGTVLGAALFSFVARAEQRSCETVEHEQHPQGAQQAPPLPETVPEPVPQWKRYNWRWGPAPPSFEGMVRTRPGAHGSE